MKKLGSGIPGSSEIQYKESDIDESMSSSSISDDEEEEIMKELADVTFEELKNTRSNGAHAFFKKRGEDKKLKRLNKNRPMEASSKKPVPVFRDVIHAPKKVACDPRFNSLCGDLLDSNRFRKKYKFLYENDLPAERQTLKRELKKCKDPERRSEIEELVSWIDKQLKPDSARNIEAEILARHKKKQREAAKEGRRPFYLKKSEIRRQRLIEKYKHLKASGNLDSYIEKRRKRNAAKDHRFMPYARSVDNE
ncbi:ribosomal RNA processing protein 36 homolog [Medicago truncatula]|uniref:rRNA biogenesis protein RRP36 n=1 Tax=Medicago truncatula TaxID=3880 RepID=A0A072UCN1_MEDTR|nr:ribosomal RNA processing protein 36 homolog [Medicago truncatula]KEH26813.1 ribosomal RNA processing-like protein [Medicago truncatula]